MLRIIRKKETTKKIIFWALLIVIVFAFGLWGSGASKQSAREKPYAGVIGKRKIPTQEFNLIRREAISNARLRFGDYYEKLLPYLNIDNQAWIRIALLDYAKKSKIKVSDKEVIDEIAKIGIFYKDGRFNQATYERVTKYYLNSQPRDFEEQTRHDLIIREIFDKVTKDTNVSDDEILKAYKEENELISTNYLKVSPEDFSKNIQLSEEELNSYFQNNQDRFKRPQTVKIEYIGLNFPDTAKEIDKMDLFEKLKSLYPRLKNAQSFKGITQEPFIYQETGFFASDEPIEGIGLQANFYLQAFSLNEGEVSPVIQTTAGVYVLRVIEKKLPFIPSFQEAKAAARNTLLEIKSREQAKDKIQEYKDKIEQKLKSEPAFSLKESNALLGAESKTTPLFKRQGPAVDSDISQEIIGAAFSLKANQISDIITTEQGYFLIEQAQFAGIDTEKFDKEKDTFSKNILEQKKQEAFNNFVNDLTAKSQLKDYTSR